jgi:hypothetical protein
MSTFLSSILSRELIPGILMEAVLSWQMYYDFIIEVKSTMDNGAWELQFNNLANWINLLLPWVRTCPLHRFPTDGRWNENFLHALFDFTIYVALQEHPLVIIFYFLLLVVNAGFWIKTFFIICGSCRFQKG